MKNMPHIFLASAEVRLDRNTESQVMREGKKRKP